MKINWLYVLGLIAIVGVAIKLCIVMLGIVLFAKILQWIFAAGTVICVVAFAIFMATNTTNLDDKDNDR